MGGWGLVAGVGFVCKGKVFEVRLEGNETIWLGIFDFSSVPDFTVGAAFLGGVVGCLGIASGLFIMGYLP